MPQDASQTCLWDYCLSYNDFVGYFDKNTSTIAADYDNEEPAHWLLGIMIYLWGFMASGGELQNAEASFAMNAAAILDALIGLMAGVFMAINIINASVQDSYYNSAAVYDKFLGYGGNSILGNFVGISQGIWVVVFLMVAATLAVQPLKLGIDIANKGSDGMTALYYHVLNAFGAYVSFYMVKNSTDILFGTWDTAMATNYPDHNNEIAIFMDMLNHNLVAMAFGGVAVAVATGPFAYSQMDLNPDNVPKWFTEMGDMLFQMND